MLFESTLGCALQGFRQNRNSSITRTLEFLVGAGGFEPPKLKAADLQSVPIGHSGTRPYSFCKSRRLPIYDNTEFAACQQLISAFLGSGGSSLHNGYRRSTQNKGAHSCPKRVFPKFVARSGHFATHIKAKIPRYTPLFQRYIAGFFLELVTGVEPATH